MHEVDPEHVEARSVLLDALDALADLRDASLAVTNEIRPQPSEDAAQGKP